MSSDGNCRCESGYMRCRETSIAIAIAIAMMNMMSMGRLMDMGSNTFDPNDIKYSNMRDDIRYLSY